MSIGRVGFSNSAKAGDAISGSYQLLHRYAFADAIRDPATNRVVQLIDTGSRGVDSNIANVSATQAILNADGATVTLRDTYFIYTFQQSTTNPPAAITNNHVVYVWVKDIQNFAGLAPTSSYVGARAVLFDIANAYSEQIQVLAKANNAGQVSAYMGAIQNITVGDLGPQQNMAAIQDQYVLLCCSFATSTATIIGQAGNVILDGTTGPAFPQFGTNVIALDSFQWLQAFFTASGYLGTALPLSIGEVAIAKYNQVPTIQDFIGYYALTKATYGL